MVLLSQEAEEKEEGGGEQRGRNSQCNFTETHRNFCLTFLVPSLGFFYEGNHTICE